MTDHDRIREAIEAITGEPYTKALPPLNKGDAADAIIATIPLQIADARKEVAEGLNFAFFGSEQAGEITVDMIPPKMVQHMIHLDRAITGFGGGPLFMSRRLDPYQGFEIGRAYERSKTEPTTEPTDPVTAAFLKYLGRPPKKSGHDYYTAQIANGRPVAEVVEEIARAAR